MAVTTDEEASALELLEAEIRVAMAKVHEARGWDTRRQRDDDLAWLDVLLDAWLAMTRG